MKYFNGNLTSKYAYSASHMTGGLEEKLGNLREGKKKDTNSESNFTDFLSHIAILIFVLVLHFFLFLFFILKDWAHSSHSFGLTFRTNDR